MNDILSRHILQSTGAFERQDALSHYYDGNTFQLEEWQRLPGYMKCRVEGKSVPLRHTLQLPDPHDRTEVLDEISRKLRVVSHGENTFEIATVDGRSTAGEYFLHIST